MEYGNINYDVPQKRKQAYAKLRSLFRRSALMQTASSYLFPWGMAKQIEQGIQKINTDEDGMPLPDDIQVKYSIFKYDEKTSGKAIQQSAEDALQRMLANMKETVNKRVHSLFLEETESDVKDPLVSAKAATNRAESLLRDAKALALVFNLTDNMEAAFLAYEAYIMKRKDAITDWEKDQAESKIDAFEASLRRDNVSQPV